MAKTRRKPTNQSRHQMIRIDILPDDVLLEIFDLYLMSIKVLWVGREGEDAWQKLVHVCRRWRNLVFGSPRHLKLQLFCTQKTSTRDKLDVWPALPLIIDGGMYFSSATDNIVAALRQSNRVCEVNLVSLGIWELEEFLAAMQVPYPVLTDLRLSSDLITLPVIPDSFLGGSAPRLQCFSLTCIPFPGLPRLLLSATHLVHLHLSYIPHSGYISPEAMTTLLSALSSLTSLLLTFRFPQSCPDSGSRCPPPSKRSVIPALTYLNFKGVVGYLEDLVTFIDAPRLDDFIITFFYIDIDTPRLAQFINRTPKLRKRDAFVRFCDYAASVRLPTQSRGTLKIEVSCSKPDRQLSSVARVCNSSLSHLSTVEDLFVTRHYCSERFWKNVAIENTLWLQLLLPFTAVKNLYLSMEVAPGIVAALQELVGGRITEVLPSLQNIFVEGLDPSGPFQENIEFVASRELSGHPVAISDWDNYSESDMGSV